MPSFDNGEKFPDAELAQSARQRRLDVAADFVVSASIENLNNTAVHHKPDGSYTVRDYAGGPRITVFSSEEN